MIDGMLARLAGMDRTDPRPLVPSRSGAGGQGQRREGEGVLQGTVVRAGEAVREEGLQLNGPRVLRPVHSEMSVACDPNSLA